MSADLIIGVSADLMPVEGTPSPGDPLLAALQSVGGFQTRALPAGLAELPKNLAGEFDAIVLGTPTAGAELVSAGAGRLRIIARHGAGFDAIDLDAMTAAGILIVNAPDAIQRPVALTAITFVLALAQGLLPKDALVRSGRWQERGSHIGIGITNRVLGVIGSGGVGRETLRLGDALGLRTVLAKSPRNAASRSGGPAELLDLAELLAVSDFVVVASRLTPETRHLLGAAQLRQMKKTAYLINVARGALIDEPALVEALREKTIAGAGLDVFEREPIDPSNPLLLMDNVVLSPHALCWTTETFDAIAASAVESLCDFARRTTPKNLVNPGVMQHLRAREWFNDPLT